MATNKKDQSTIASYAKPIVFTLACAHLIHQGVKFFKSTPIKVDSASSYKQQIALCTKVQVAIDGLPAKLIKVIQDYITQGRLEVADQIQAGMKCKITETGVSAIMKFSTPQQAMDIIKPSLTTMASENYDEISSYVKSTASASYQSLSTAFTELTKYMDSLKTLLDAPSTLTKVAEETVSPITHMVTGASALYVGQEVVSCLDYYFAGVDIDFSNHTSGN